MTKHPSKRSHSAKCGSIPYRCAFAIALTLCAGGILLFISTIIAYAQADPAILSRQLALASLLISAIIGGYVSARGAGHPLLMSAICGIGTVLILMLISLIPWGDGANDRSLLYRLGMHSCVIVASIAGGLITMKKTKKRPGRHAKPRRK